MKLEIKDLPQAHRKDLKNFTPFRIAQNPSFSSSFAAKPSSSTATWRKFQAESSSRQSPIHIDLNPSEKQLVEQLFQAFFAGDQLLLLATIHQLFLYTSQGEMTQQKALLKALAHMAKCFIDLTREDYHALIEDVCTIFYLEETYLSDFMDFSESLKKEIPCIKGIFYLVHQEKEKGIFELQQAAAKGDAPSRLFLQKMGETWPDLPDASFEDAYLKDWPPTFLENGLDEAKALFLKGDYEKALQICDQILERENSVDGKPFFYATHNLRGDCLLLLGRYEEAVRDYQLDIPVSYLACKAQLAKRLSKQSIELPPSLEEEGLGRIFAQLLALI